jgi:hypothetical protein
VRRVVDGALVALVAWLMASQAWGYFVDYGAMDEPWSSTTREARHIAALGRAGPVYSLETSEHRVKSGWVRFLARGVATGSLASPGDQLPLIAPDEPFTSLTWRQRVPLPSRDETMSFVLYGPAQLPYLALLRELYGAGSRASQVDRTVFRVPPQAMPRQGGVLVHAGRTRALVEAFGQIPAGTMLPVELRWTTGIRVAYAGRHRVELTAPAGSRLFIDGVEVIMVGVAEGRGRRPVTRDVRVPGGLHFIELRAGVRSRAERIALRWSGRQSPAGAVRPLRPLTPPETYPDMTSAWGLLNEVTGEARTRAGADAWPRLSATVAAGFADTPLETPSAGTISWRGRLVVPRAGRYRLSFRSDGEPTVTLDGARLSATALTRARDAGVQLAPGSHPIVVSLSTAGTASFIRWLWIPPTRDRNRRAGEHWAIVPPSALRPAGAVEVVGPPPG